EGRFAAEDFLREIKKLAAIFTTVRIDGPDYRHRDLPPAPAPLSDDEVIDRLYDAGIPVVASGTKLDGIFSDEMLAGGFRKKYLRATSRLIALTSGGPAMSRSREEQ